MVFQYMNMKIYFNCIVGWTFDGNSLANAEGQENNYLKLLAMWNSRFIGDETVSDRVLKVTAKSSNSLPHLAFKSSQLKYA